jgi:nucleoside-specific outer membrane channel protein Tsx
MDISAGKTIYSGDGNLHGIRAYAMSGLYVFQTNLTDYMQNDAFLYGAGLDLDFGRLQMEHQLGGYAGYLGNGDKPMVYRMNLSWIQGSVTEIKLRFQQGFIDFPYTTLRLSTLINF